MHESQEVILARLDERVGSVMEQLAVLHANDKALDAKVSELPSAMLEKGEKRFAPRSRYVIVERAVFGFIAAVMIGLVGLGIRYGYPTRVMPASAAQTAEIGEAPNQPVRVIKGRKIDDDTP